MQKAKLIGRIDAIIRCLLYLLIFWLPYSPAVVETSVILALLLWMVKRCILFIELSNKKVSDKHKTFKLFWEAFRPKSTFLNAPIGFFLLICVISVVGSAFWERALHGFFTKTLEWFIVFFLTIEVFNKREHVLLAVSILMFSALATGLDSILQYHVIHRDIFYGNVVQAADRATAAFKTANSLAGYLIFIIPISFSLLFLNRKKLDGGLTLMFLIMVWAMILTFARTSWIAVFLGILFYLFFVNKRICSLFFAGLLIIWVALYVILPQEAKVNLRIDSKELVGASTWRSEIWQDSLGMIARKPFWGHGLNTYMIVFQEFRRKLDGMFYYGPTYAHNCYIQMAAEIGIFGLAAFLWIMIRLFKLTIQKMNKSKCLDARLKELMLGLLSGVLAFLIHSFFDTNFYSLQLSVLFWLMTGLLMSVHKLLNEEAIHDIKVPSY